MITKLSHTTIWVLDQDEALDFYTHGSSALRSTPTQPCTTSAG